jgi:hypothetical protein
MALHVLLGRAHGIYRPWANGCRYQYLRVLGGTRGASADRRRGQRGRIVYGGGEKLAWQTVSQRRSAKCGRSCSRDYGDRPRGDPGGGNSRSLLLDELCQDGDPSARFPAYPGSDAEAQEAGFDRVRSGSSGALQSVSRSAGSVAGEGGRSAPGDREPARPRSGNPDAILLSGAGCGTNLPGNVAHGKPVPPHEIPRDREVRQPYPSAEWHARRYKKEGGSTKSGRASGNFRLYGAKPRGLGGFGRGPGRLRRRPRSRRASGEPARARRCQVRGRGGRRVSGVARLRG